MAVTMTSRPPRMRSNGSRIKVGEPPVEWARVAGERFML